MLLTLLLGQPTGPAPVEGTLSITEAADTGSASASVILAATASITNGADTASGSGSIPASATSSINEAGDSLTAAVGVTVAATGSITEGADTLSASGTVGSSPVTGTASITEAADTASAAAGVLVGGTASIGEAADTGAGSASVAIGATLVRTEGADTGAGSGQVALSASASINEASDTVAAAAGVPVAASAAITEGADTLSASGSVGSTGITATANLTEVGDDCRRTNLVPNSTMQGAAAGTPGTMPSGWATTTYTGITRQIVGAGVDGGTGLAYIDVRFFGTSGIAGTAYNGIAMMSDTQAAIGQTFTHSAYFALIAAPSLSNLTFQIRENNASGSYLGHTAFSLTAISSTLTRYSITRTLSSRAAGLVGSWIEAVTNNGQVIDFTLRIADPQMEQAASVGPYDPTYGTAYTGGRASVAIGASAVMNEVADGLLAAAGIPIVVAGGSVEVGDSLSAAAQVAVRGDGLLSESPDTLAALVDVSASAEFAKPRLCSARQRGLVTSAAARLIRTGAAARPPTIAVPPRLTFAGARRRTTTLES